MDETSQLKYDEYEQLGLEAQKYGALQRQALASALSGMEEKRAERIDPKMSFLMGAIGGAFRENTSAGSEALKAHNAAVESSLKDEVDSYTLLGGYASDESNRINELRKKLLDWKTASATAEGSRYYLAGNTKDGLVRVDKYGGDVELVVPPAGFAPEYSKIFSESMKRYTEGGVGVEEAQQYSHKDALKQIGGMMGMHPFGNVPIQQNAPPVGSNSVTPAAATPAAATPAAATPANDHKSQQAAILRSELAKLPQNHPQRAALEKEIANFESAKPVKSGSFVGNNTTMQDVHSAVTGKYPPMDADTPPIGGSRPVLLTAAQQKQYAEENTADRESLSSVRNMNNSIDIMAGIMNSGVHTSGKAHEFFNKLGGYVAYIDPDNTLAKNVENDEAYYGELMNLTRKKIEALGSGTAVSNLDLIVTQKSVGDLRNLPGGNKKLLAIMALQGATLEAKANTKLDYFSKTNNYRDYRGDNSTTHIIRRSPKTGDYWVQSKDDWVIEQVSKGRVKDPKEAEKDFEREARKATGNLISGTGITFAGEQ